MKILLLEDDLSLREIVTDALQNQGYHVSAFKDGESAMDSLLTTSFDLMLLDINVPGINGYEFLEALRDTGNDTPAIFISSYTDIDHLSKGYAHAGTYKSTFTNRTTPDGSASDRTSSHCSITYPSSSCDTANTARRGTAASSNSSRRDSTSARTTTRSTIT